MLGAFAAGLIIGLVTQGETGEQVLPRFWTIGYGFLIPVFFIVTGMEYDLDGLLTAEGLALGALFLRSCSSHAERRALLSYRELGARRTARSHSSARPGSP